MFLWFDFSGAGTVCFDCGHALDAYPTLDIPAAVKKYKTERQFKLEVDLIRIGVSKCRDKLRREFLEHTVREATTIGIRVVLKVGFVTVAIFSIIFKIQASRVSKLSVIKLPSPEAGKDLEGVLMRLADIPPRTPHYEVELFAKTSAALETLHLTPSDILRTDQAAEEFEDVQKLLLQNRPSALRLERAVRVKSFKKIEGCALEAKEERELAEKKREDDMACADSDKEGEAAPPCVVVAAGRRGARRAAQQELVFLTP